MCNYICLYILYCCSGLITQKCKMIKSKKKKVIIIITHLHIVMTLQREKKPRKNNSRYHYDPYNIII